MRPVNLIPVDERRGASRGPAGSTGNGVYIMLGVLGVALFGTVLVVLQGNKINSQKSELAKLSAEQTKAKNTVDSTAPDLAFEAAAQARFDMVHKTAADRFDFERRLRQLTRVTPNTVKLTKLSASLTGADSDSGTSGNGSSTSSTGAATGDPTFNLTMCIIKGDVWQQLAETITRMRNLDGVKKVTIDKSSKPDQSSASQPAASGGGDSSGPCGTGDANGALRVTFKGKAPAAGAASPAGATPQTATQQAQGAANTSNTSNTAGGGAP